MVTAPVVFCAVCALLSIGGVWFTSYVWRLIAKECQRVVDLLEKHDS